MEGDNPEGNPKAAELQPLPVRADACIANDCISMSESSGETHTEGTDLSSEDQGKDETQPNDTMGSEPQSNTKLCGYLQKQGGPLKAWKCRWFTYEEKKCQLFYYRTAQDVNPLGRVELSSALFSYPLQGEEGTFHIQTPERLFVLKAANRDAKMYWLQQLQLKRWQHRNQLTGALTLPTPDRQQHDEKDTCSEDFLPTVKTPPGLVGEEAASQPIARLRSPLNVSLKHPLIEIQNSMHSLRQNRNSQEISRSVFHYQDVPSFLSESPNTPVPNHQTLAVPSSQSMSQTPVLLAEPVSDGTRESMRSPSPSPSPGLSPSPRSRKMKRGLSATVPFDRKETKAMDKTLSLHHEKLTLAEEVKAQKKLVWLLHKALEAAQLEKRTCAEFLAAKGEEERLELLRHRERHVADLQGRLDDLRRETEALRQSQTQKDVQIAELQDNVKLLMDKNNAKQEVILRLSEQMVTCMADPQCNISSGMSAETFRQLNLETENLRDDLEAYKTQNRFLNSEIYQLTRLWRNSSEREKCLMVKCAYLEATNCRMESRYLGVLQKLQENKTLDTVQREAVRKLIEDALDGDINGVLSINANREYDEYGFKIMPDYEVEDMKLLGKIQALEIRSQNLLVQEAGDRPVLSRWTQYLGGRSPEDLSPSHELKNLLRGGVPREYRQQVWRWVVRTRTRSIWNRYPDRYQELCEKSRTSPHPAFRQIQLDLHRTLTTNQNFSSPSSPALQQLQRVLRAFSWQNPTVGYCQGLNRLAAIGLLVLQNEEEAFWFLVAVVEVLMPPNYYTKTLLASQADQRVLKDFMAEKMPRLTAHLEEHNVDVSLITFNWFLVVFVESLPSDILLKVWDAFLYEGSKVMFRYALAVFKYKEEDILKIHDSVEIYQYLRFFTKTITDSRKLTAIAFNDMNPFPKKLMRQRRTQHLERLQAELRELEALQREYITESSHHEDKELDNIASEDDDDA
ncbi:TBC1 domain family member 2A [Chanos chanos]|uniref:TBC1 domain family member 2A n=1 Tax=Chanos chanos TaxID=29144 RepID=A0A6J2UQ12_CHACN|nr:TBC1 domain family member 2A [Chanos chanos]